MTKTNNMTEEIKEMTEREQFLVESLIHLSYFHHLEDDISGFIDRVLYLFREMPVKSDKENKQAVKDKVHEMYLDNEMVSRELLDFIEDKLD